MERENAIEEIYSRRVGITKDGVVFKQLRTQPVTYDPMDPCAEMCCKFGRFKEEEHQSTTKVIPPAQVQDIKVEEPAGGTCSSGMADRPLRWGASWSRYVQMSGEASSA